MPRIALTPKGKTITAVFTGTALCTAFAFGVFTHMGLFEPGVPPDNVATTLVGGMATTAENYLAGSLDANDPRTTLRRLCTSLDTGLNGVMENVGAQSRFDVKFDPENARSRLYPNGTCIISFNGQIVHGFAETQNLDSAAEIQDLRDSIFRNLPEADIIKIHNAPASAFNPLTPKGP